jgi:hypothetical protein
MDRYSSEIPPPKLISTLGRYELLPAIVFLPTRRKCDEAALAVAADRSQKAQPERIRERQRIFDEFAKLSPEITAHKHRKMIVQSGVASHHAGHIPAWKLLIEKMMSGGLLNAIFATSTVAAGVAAGSGVTAAGVSTGGAATGSVIGAGAGACATGVRALWPESLTTFMSTAPPSAPAATRTTTYIGFIVAASDHCRRRRVFSRFAPGAAKLRILSIMRVFPSHFDIGPVRVSPATVLAPMAGVTDTVFRRFIRNLGGCGLLMTEFTSSHGISASHGARKITKTMKYLAFEPEERPISAQLFGADPEIMADAARVCQDLGFDIVDVNFGCPVNKW